jgi:preprotein translocase subunit SecF
MRIVPFKSIWLTFSSILVVASIVVYGMYGLKLSADFTEGTLLALKFDVDAVEEVIGEDAETEAILETSDEAEGAERESVSQEELRDAFRAYEAPEGQEALNSVDIKRSPDGTFVMKMRRLSEEESASVLGYLNDVVGEYELLQSRDVSPQFAKTFRDRAALALLTASLMIILYITFAFRRVSRGIKSWKLGVAAIIALIHDLAIIVGIFVLLGQFMQVEIDALFITALLSVMGFSVNDTIVVFDRVRENLLIKHHAESFEEVAERSLQQTLARSINTSFSTLLVLVSLLVFGAYEIFYFVLALALGVVVGTYSSIFLATPLLTVMQKKNK